MKLATSMWSAQMRCSAPPSRSRPWTVITFEPMPSIWAPILTNSRARSWTWGSQAAFPIVVGPGVSAAAMSAFSVAITEGSSMKIPHGRRPAGPGDDDLALTLDPGAHVAEGVEVRIEAAAADEVASGGGMRASKRANSGLASKNEARIRSASNPSSGAGRGDRMGPEAKLVDRRPFGAHPDALEHRDLRLRVTDPHVGQHHLLVGEQAARIGSAAFLLPAAMISWRAVGRPDELPSDG